ncbi:cysteine hydrolase family protein [Vibrio celticus]|uniref:Isochorismatase family protein YecD n=1 Tax=Vibrio celticus TaxID=446372 RepID=A0A1C3JKI9_9VIBR|nr:isochorismatase family cysteine hydrolase [Vibrio celticus]SBT15609.1 Isochorismatase family protein YecD [Vibrio celticus]
MKKQFIEGNPALIVIDVQGKLFIERERPIPNMERYDERKALAGELIKQARACNIPVIFIQEVHRDNLVDFGRELDGAEDIHCLESNPNTAICADEIDFRPDDYLIKKRRYSAFFGTDLEILLKGLKVDTLLLCGCLTDVCVHYTFVDGHQMDYYCRVVEDCVAGSSLKAHEGALEAMEYLQTGAVATLEKATNEMQTFAVKQTQIAS